MAESLTWCASPFAPPDEQSLHQTLPEWLASASARWPDLPAVVMGDQFWTYADLAKRAAGIAVQIESATMEPGPVALVQSVGFDAVASWFACSLAGRAFLLLEPDHPTTRLCQLIESAGCPLILGDDVTAPILANLPHLRTLIPHQSVSTEVKSKGLRSNDPAMIFPTSGSTGEPKLVTYSATTLQAKAQSSKHLMRVPEGARVVIASSHANYGFLHHAYVFLLAGGTLCLANLKADGFSSVVEAIDRNEARHARFTPSMFRKLASLPEARKALLKLDAVRFSGEPLLVSDLTLAQSALKSECLIQNVYGSTESALFIWSNKDNEAVPNIDLTAPMGRLYPLASWALAPLEENEVEGDVGELVIRSAFHALGDYRGGQIDQARFPLWRPNSEERVYFTGDIVRCQSDGNLIHLGRRGRMVKIRGHRVFLAEIENHLRALPGVAGAEVIERVENDSSVLYAFITVNADQPPVQDLREQLVLRLPDFMVPRKVLEVSEIPVLAGGKVDHNALLAQLPVWQSESPAQQVANDDADKLNQIWDSVLWVGAHQHDADFVALGGDSLKLMALSLEVERAFGQSLPLDDFLTDSSLKHLRVLLGVNRDVSFEPKHSGLRFRQVWPGEFPNARVALAMPGWEGKAMAVPFGRAGLFQGYELWAADYEFDKGNMRDAGRWWHAAQSIVEGIQSGAIPRPEVIFGYSFGGGLAWLVSRLLVGTPNCPRFVVMVDSAPLHRLRSFRPRKASRLLKRVSGKQMPATLHIQRSLRSEWGIGPRSIQRWHASDQISMRIDLPTIDHGEMCQSEILALAKDGVNAFLNGLSRDLIVHDARLGTIGSRLHRIMSEPEKMVVTDLKGLLEALSSKFNTNYFVGLMYLNGRSDKFDIAPTLIDTALRHIPHSRLIRFASRRLRRDVSMLCPYDMPVFLPSRLAVVERGLARPMREQASRQSILLRLMCLACDIFLQFKKYKHHNR